MSVQANVHTLACSAHNERTAHSHIAHTPIMCVVVSSRHYVLSSRVGNTKNHVLTFAFSLMLFNICSLAALFTFSALHGLFVALCLYPPINSRCFSGAGSLLYVAVLWNLYRSGISELAEASSLGISLELLRTWLREACLCRWSPVESVQITFVLGPIPVSGHILREHCYLLEEHDNRGMRIFQSVLFLNSSVSLCSKHHASLDPRWANPLPVLLGTMDIIEH